ncbi:MAG: tetratricopeptide repeat protein [Planctomycetaceae bacterium]|jgi:tetratricopeptide (TPR) repeat protein|nr:tetratricopeptide repeat protein [Planctomycetaceae bacterium]
MEETSEIDELCQEARRCLKQGELDRAMALFQQALEVDSGHVLALEGLAAACFYAESYDEAIEHFGRLAELTPRDAKPQINLGAVHSRLKQYPQAVESLRKAVQKDSQSSEAFYNLGIAYRNLEEMGMATTAYREALRLNPEMSEAHVNLGNLYVEMSNFRSAITHYNEALKLKPGLQRAEAGLRKAEEATKASQTQFSPFGRLVDATKENPADVASGGGRVLSSVERGKDRRAILELASEIHDSSNDVKEQLKSEMVAVLLDLGRSISEGADRASNIVETQDEFESTVERSMALRRRLRKAMQALEDHEQQMNRSEFDEG